MFSKTWLGFSHVELVILALNVKSDIRQDWLWSVERHLVVFGYRQIFYPSSPGPPQIFLFFYPLFVYVSNSLSGIGSCVLYRAVGMGGGSLMVDHKHDLIFGEFFFYKKNPFLIFGEKIFYKKPFLIFWEKSFVRKIDLYEILWGIPSVHRRPS